MQVERTLRELRQLAEATGDGELRQRVVAEVFQQTAGKVAHVEQRAVGEAVAPADGLLRYVAGRAGDMLEAGGARHVDAAVNGVDPGGAGIGNDDSRRAEDRQPADDAEPRVPGF